VRPANDEAVTQLPLASLADGLTLVNKRPKASQQMGKAGRRRREYASGPGRRPGPLAPVV